MTRRSSFCGCSEFFWPAVGGSHRAASLQYLNKSKAFLIAWCVSQSGSITTPSCLFPNGFLDGAGNDTRPGINVMTLNQSGDSITGKWAPGHGPGV